MKNVLFTIVALLLPEVIMATGDYHVYGTKIGSIYYHLNSSNKTASVTCKYYEEEMNRFYACENDYIGAIVIPQKVTHEDIVYPVTSIGQYAFYGCSGLTSINIPNSVTSIGYNAFYGCSGLTTIVSEIENPFSIDNSVFNGIDSNVLLIVPKGKRSVYQSTEGWKQFTNILEVGEGGDIGQIIKVDNINYKIGENNTMSVTKSVNKLQDDDLGDLVIQSQITYNGIKYNVTSIEALAFNISASAWGITSITIPSSIKVIGGDAFLDQFGLRAVYITDLEAWCKISFGGEYSNPLQNANHLYINGNEIQNLVIPNSVTSICDCTFWGCRGLTSVTIPNSVTSIGRRAFSDCSGLPSITIPNSVTSIDRAAFSGCNGLTSVVSEIENPFEIGNNVFDSNIYNTATLTVPAGKKSAYQSTAGWNNFKNIIEIGGVGYEFESDGINYRVGGNYTVSVISKNTKYSGDVVIPSQVTYNGKTYSVTSIGISAFYNCNSLTSVTIPSSVTSIGYSAFEGCNSLTSVNIPNGVTRIDEDTFNGCRSLTSIAIPSSVTYINCDAFHNCSSLTNVHISDFSAWCKLSFDCYHANPLTYADHLFLNGEEVKNLIIPSSVTSIGAYVFSSCKGLTSVTIPNSVTSIGVGAFSGCSGLTTIVSEIENPFSIDNSVFNGIDSNVPLIVPKGKRSVYQSTEGWKQFTNILEVGEFEVNGIRYLIGENNTVSVRSKSTKYSGDVVIPSQVTYNGKIYSVTSIGISAFYNCNSLTSVTIPNSVTSIGYSAFEGCNSLTSVTIPNGVTRIDEDTFSDCRSLTSIFIPSSVTYIDCGAFRNCSSLTSVHISDLAAWCKISFFCMYANPLTYADHLFLNGEEIKNLTIPSNVTSIGDQAFFGCSGLTSVTIPSSVTSIGDYAFSSCTGLTTIVSEIENPFSIDNSVFNGIDSNILLIVPKGKRSVYQSTEGWKQFTNILEVGEFEVNGIRYLIGENNTVSVISKSTKYSGDVVIPGQVTYYGKTYSVTSIGKWAFSSCTDVTSVTIPNSVTSINSYAFASCRMTSVIIPNSVTSIGLGAFQGCTELISITIPNSVKVIYDDAFNLCAGLTSVYIYDIDAWCRITFDNLLSNPLSHGGHLFINDKEIRDLIIPNSVTSINRYAFCCCSGLTSVTMPNSVSSIGDYAFKDCNNLTEVYCLAEQVPNTKSNSFQSSNIGNATLHVPATSINAYKNASPWNQFKVIVPTGNTLFKLIYKVDDVEYKTYDVEYGTAITPEPTPTKEGYTFSGWSEIPEKMPAKDVTVTGTFTINKYKLTYLVDGVEYKTKDVEYNATITPESAPTKEGYTFSGWSEIPEKMPAKDVTVTGSFTINKYKLTYKVDDIEYKTYDVEYGTTITPEPAPTKEGYTFSGWSEIPEKMPAKDVTIVGTFSKLKYKLTYIVDGEIYKSYEIKPGSTIIPEVEPTKEGFTFSGWSEIPEEMPAKDVTVTGTFTKDIKKGDINGDNTVNGKDIDEIVNYLMGKPSNSFDIKAADVNGDEKVNAADIVTIVKIIKGNQ